MGGQPAFVADSLWVRTNRVVLPCPWRESVQVTGARVKAWHGDTLWLTDFSRDSAKIRFWRWAGCTTAQQAVPVSRGNRAGVPGPPGDVAPETPTPEALCIQGFKSFTVTGGPGTPARFQQAAQVQFQGRVGGFRISGVLNDQNLSTTGTEELAALDRLLLNLQGSALSVHLGDLELVASDPPLRGRGGALQWRLSHATLKVAYALRRGDPITREIPLQDGYAGPYFLDPAGKPVQVLPGSERVYLNGIRLRAGRDYLLDPRTGTLVFTPAIRVQQTDHLRVTFEQIQAFPGRTLSLITLASPGTDSTWQVRYLQDGYSASALNTFLSPLDLQRLAQLGDTSGLVVLDGGIRVGEGRGAYVREDSVYRYVGPGQGDYQVSFEYVGEGQGSYVYDAVLGGYRFVGAGQGAYVPRVRQPVPSRYRLVGLRLRLPQGLRLNLEGEELQRNVLVPLRHREGAARVRWRHHWSSVPLRPEVELFGFGATARFQRPEGSRVPPDLAARYRLAEQERGEVRAAGARVGLTPIQGWHLVLESQELWIGHRSGSFGAVDLRGAWGPWTLRAFGEQTRLPRREHWQRAGLTLGWRHLPGVPTVQTLAVRADTLVYREISLLWRPGHQRLELHGRRNLRAQTLEGWLLLGLQIPLAHLQSEVQVFHSTRLRSPRFLMQARWHQGPVSGFHEVGRGALQGTGVRYVYVGPGQGDYAYDPETGEYHPDPHGDYRRETLNLGSLQQAKTQQHRLEVLWHASGQVHRASVAWQQRSGAQNQFQRLDLDYSGTRAPWILTLRFRREHQTTFWDTWGQARLERKLGTGWLAFAGYEFRESQGTYSLIRRRQEPYGGLGWQRERSRMEARALYGMVEPMGQPVYRNPRVEVRWLPQENLPLNLRLTGTLALGYGWLSHPLPVGWTPVLLGVEIGPYATGNLQLSRSLGQATTVSLTASGDARRGMPARLFLSATLNLAF